MWTLLCALAGAAVSIAPAGFPMRGAGLLCLLPLLLASPRTPARDELWITALDIGQGSSLLVEAGSARLLFDAGPGSGVDRSAASRFLVPYLRSRGIETIDTLVVSHLDVEHAGGTAAVVQALRPKRLLTGFDARLLQVEPDALARVEHESCVAGRSLQLGPATIEVLHPPAVAKNRRQARDNASGCVLRIVSPAGSVLLTADLPSAAEPRLVISSGEKLRSDVLTVPQQGGRGGTGERLLVAVQPAHALLQVGYRNRHRHPHPTVLERLDRQGTSVLRTDFDGAIQLRLHRGQPPQVHRWRRDAPPYWRIDAAIAPSSPHRSTTPPRAPDPPPASTGTPPSRRSAPG
jgi:competence protein ComEC